MTYRTDYKYIDKDIKIVALALAQIPDTKLRFQTERHIWKTVGK